MARTKTASGIQHHIVDAEMPTTAVDTVNRNQLAINQQYGLEPFNKERVETEVAFFLVQANQSFWEAGTRLIQLKENLQHGDFLESLAKIDIAPRTASGLMKGALKYANRHSLADLTQAAGSRTKLLELAILDDDDLQELNDGGTVAGLTLDDVERMTTRELKAALRKTRQDTAEAVKIKDSIIAAKDKKLNELDEKLTAIQLKKQDEPKPAPVFKPIGTEELEAVQKITTDINAKIGAELRFAIDRFYQAFGDDYPNRAMRLGLAHCIGHIITTLDDVAEAYRIQPEIDLKTADVDPAKADAEAFMKMMASDEPIVIDGLAEFNERMGITPANTKPIGEQFAEWEEEATLFDNEGNLKPVFTKE
jgi:hypothetical protein